MVAAALEAAIPRLACRLPRDVYAALQDALAREGQPLAQTVLTQLSENANIATGAHVPICQDTGTVWVCLEIGPDVVVAGDVFSQVNKAVAQAYVGARLRKSLVGNALFGRVNTQDNTPAFTQLLMSDEPGCAKLHVMLKGGGSDNASRVVMLTPGVGRAGIVEEVVRCVREKAANACPPLVIGVGIGGTFDTVAALAKHALLRRIGDQAASPEAAELEAELLAAVNGTGVGAGGIGGATTALAVHVETAACHIAALPLAINMGCSVLRRATIDLAGDVSVGAQLDGQLVGCANQDSDVPHPAASQLQKDAESPHPGQPVHALTLPLTHEQLEPLRAGDCCTLSGPLYTLRDAGHVRLLEELHANCGELPYELAGQTIFYAGPSPEVEGQPFGAVGPTTASRMDFAAPELYDAGIVATVGKGKRSAEVTEACVRNKAVYFAATGGAAALLARHVTQAEVIAYDDLGTEALRRIEVVGFPVFVGTDISGESVYL